MSKTQAVTCDNFDRAETHSYFKRYVGLGAFGKFFHVRQPTPVDRQDVIRMNRDTLYSLVVLDLTTPATIGKPESGGRFQSLMPINEDHSIFPCEYGAGEFTFTREMLGSRYAALVVRTFVDANDSEDIAAANALQDGLYIKQAAPGSFEVPEWDEQSLKGVREAYLTLATTVKDFSEMFGIKGEMDRLYHMLGTAAGWGGNSKQDAMYDNVVPEHNDGTTPYVLTVRDVPVKGFWSITVYNKDGYMQANDLDAYSFNNVTAEKAEDGSIEIHLGGSSDSSNYLPITPGWSYAVRMYRPDQALLDGAWRFPKAVPQTL